MHNHKNFSTLPELKLKISAELPLFVVQRPWTRIRWHELRFAHAHLQPSNLFHCLALVRSEEEGNARLAL